ncbi:hypothetical protein [Micromonospora coerulea]|uniref:hypothetical protein n=1 Tax=Micromonospora coerulea TaxID=47856 RepID=UPI001908B4A2|nr:hypothetical protein [Micromonospora veneta]
MPDEPMDDGPQDEDEQASSDETLPDRTVPLRGGAGLYQQVQRAQLFLNSPGVRAALAQADAVQRSGALARAAAITSRVTASGFALQNFSTLASATTEWGKATNSLRQLVSALSVPRLTAWAEAVRLLRYPPNWPDGIFIREVKELADDEGIPLCWVPRAEVIDALRKAEPGRRRAILLERRAEVLDDCDQALSEVTAPELSKYASAARKVVAAMRDGHDEPAQAFAMNVVDSTLRGTLFASVPQNRFYKPMVMQIEESRDCLMQDFRQSVTLWPLLRVFDTFHPGKGDPVPSRANRHATAHTVADVQYTPVNALIATMLATSVVREVQESLTMQESDELSAAAEQATSSDQAGTLAP